MNVQQIYEIMNDVTTELLGDSIILNEDLSNIVEIGQAFENVVGLDNYVRALPDKIGKQIFVNRKYEGRSPSVIMDAWEYGSICSKVTAKLPDAVENEDWELQDGQSYDPNVFHKPDISAEFWNNRVTFEIDISKTEDQVKESFSNVTELNSFLSMITTSVENSLTVKLDSLISRTINNMIAETLYNEYNSGVYTSGSGVKAVNLLYMYNQRYGTSLTQSEMVTTPEFARFASYVMANYMDRLSVMSNLFNIGGESRFTPKSDLRVVMLSEFRNASDIFLQSGTFHDRYTALPNADAVPFWQGSGIDYDFSSTSAINVKTSGGHTVSASGILGVMFDKNALGVTNLKRTVRTHYNEKAGFWNYFYKEFAGYFNDLNENMVVFFGA